MVLTDSPLACLRCHTATTNACEIGSPPDGSIGQEALGAFDGVRGDRRGQLGQEGLDYPQVLLIECAISTTSCCNGAKDVRPPSPGRGQAIRTAAVVWSRRTGQW